MNNATMDYYIFKATTEHLVDFERYLLINVFSRKNLPAMDSSFKDRIIDNLLEMFNNVIDHSGSSFVYVCGQYFYKSSNLVFTIVDIGKTIYNNVSLYLLEQEMIVPSNTLQWAVKQGNSTKMKDAPGGLGFSILLDFLKANNGSFTLISSNEVYELNKKKERFLKMDETFPGTIVTITINLNDNFWYTLDTDMINF